MPYHSLSCMLVQYGPLKINKSLSGDRLNVSLFQAIAFCQIIKLIATLLTRVVNPHRHRVHRFNSTNSRCGAFSRPSLDFI